MKCEFWQKRRLMKIYTIQCLQWLWIRSDTTISCEQSQFRAIKIAVAKYYGRSDKIDIQFKWCDWILMEWFDSLGECTIYVAFNWLSAFRRRLALTFSCFSHFSLVFCSIWLNFCFFFSCSFHFFVCLSLFFIISPIRLHSCQNHIKISSKILFESNFTVYFQSY